MVEINLRSFRKRMFSPYKLTRDPSDKVASIYPYKSELYGITEKGNVFIMNTKQDKVLMRGKPRGEKIGGPSSFPTILVRQHNSIVIGKTTWVGENRQETSTVFYLYNKVFMQTNRLLMSKRVPVKHVPQDLTDFGRREGMLAHMVVVPLTQERFFILSTFAYCTYPLSVLYVEGTKIQHLQSLTSDVVGDSITDVRYHMGVVFICNTSKLVHRIYLHW